ncbi:MAG: adenylate/guanylate cyclase domain-containing protein [Deltaproteobacteria bacterium]|nr:adenylate/guanylate cyclase domain-containing protein [Deltaproteobacteria bacterium]
MPLIHFLPDNHKIQAHEGETILQAGLRAGIPHASFCGGSARCSTCRVVILEGLENCAPRNPAEQAIAERLRFEPQVRLACQTVVAGPVKLRRLVTDIHEEVEVNSLYVAGVEPCSIGVEKYLLILFADIRGFTPFAEDLLHYDVIHVLNLYFQQVGKVIARHGGEINNYMGDGFMALFEAADPSEGALRAVKTGLELIESVRGLKPYLEDLYQKSFEIRVGLHYGQVVAGKVGTPGNKKVTVIGDSVNLASRVETANKEAGTQFLISEDTYALVKDQVRLGRQVRLTLPGKSGEYNLFEVVGLIEAKS